jgi:hypothetical protein
VRFIRRHLVKTRPCFNAGKPRGQGLVEFALILPALLLVVVSIIDFGRLIFTISSVASASRDAARYGASVGTDAFGITHYQDCTGIRRAIQKFTYFLKLDVVIKYDEDGPGGSQAYTYCQLQMDSDSSVVATLGSQVVVEVTGNYSSLVLSGIFKLPPIPVISETRRTILRDIYID